MPRSLRRNERNYGIHEETRTEKRRNGSGGKSGIPVSGRSGAERMPVLPGDDTENGEGMPQLQKTLKAEPGGFFSAAIFDCGMRGGRILLSVGLFAGV